MAYNANPIPQQGSGAYGAVPGIINLPSNIYQQTTAAIPGLKPTAGAAAGVINSEVAGQVNPDVQNLLQQKAAALTSGTGTGGTVGVPGSFAQNNYLASLGENSQQQQEAGINDYLKFLTGVGGTQTNPELAYSVAQQNAIDAAAPNPAAAAKAQMDEFDRYSSSNGAGVYSGAAGFKNYTQTPGMNATDQWLTI